MKCTRLILWYDTSRFISLSHTKRFICISLSFIHCICNLVSYSIYNRILLLVSISHIWFESFIIFDMWLCYFIFFVLIFFGLYAHIFVFTIFRYSISQFNEGNRTFHSKLDLLSVINFMSRSIFTTLMRQKMSCRKEIENANMNKMSFQHLTDRSIYCWCFLLFVLCFRYYIPSDSCFHLQWSTLQRKKMHEVSHETTSVIRSKIKLIESTNQL